MEGQLVAITKQADEEPILQVLINYRGTPMMAHTGATYTLYLSPPHGRKIHQNFRILGTHAVNAYDSSKDENR